MSGKRNRDKGHNLEREIAKWFRDIGFIHAKTTREASKLMDKTNIDIFGVPLNIQAKAGYANSYPKYDQNALDTKRLLEMNFPSTDPIQNYPIVLVHRLDGAGKKHPERYYWCFENEFAKELLETYFKHHQLI